MRDEPLEQLQRSPHPVMAGVQHLEGLLEPDLR
jgi:hypothetical protein